MLSSTYVAGARLHRELQHHILCCADIAVYFAAGQSDAIDIEEIESALVSQRKAFDATMESFKSGSFKKCCSMLGGSSAEKRIAAGPRPETAGSSKGGASCSAGRRNGSTATAGADSLSVEGMPGKAQVPELDTPGEGAGEMPGQLLDQGRMGHTVPDIGAAAATAPMPEASTKTWDKATQARGQEAVPDEALEQSDPDVAAQRAKQARKQAKRARQRARRAQGAAADADSKVCSSMWLCVSTTCPDRLKGCIPCGLPGPAVQETVHDDA